VYTQGFNNKRRQKMNRIPTKARRALFDIMGAIVIVSVGVVLMLAYFDVLTR